jgi:hypothetical protein
MQVLQASIANLQHLKSNMVNQTWKAEVATPLSGKLALEPFVALRKLQI